MIKNYSTEFATAILDDEGTAIRSGWMVVYCAHPQTREYLCATVEYLCVGSRLPPDSYLNKPILPPAGFALIRSLDGQRWENTVDNRGNIAYDSLTGSTVKITFLGVLPEHLTLMKTELPPAF